MSRMRNTSLLLERGSEYFIRKKIILQQLAVFASLFPRIYNVFILVEGGLLRF